MTFNLDHRGEDPNPSKREEVLALMEFVLGGEDESDSRG